MTNARAQHKSGTSAEIVALADAWEKKDEAMAAVSLDRSAAAEARGHRELVCDLLLSDAPERELLTALHAYGRLLSERGASPSVLSVTIDGAKAVLGDARSAALGPSARAAVTEGYFAAAREAFGGEALRAWDPPACIARVSESTFAVAAQYPSREPDEVGAWATRIARWLKKAQATRAYVDGDPQLVREVQDAILLAGLDVGDPSKDGGGGGSGGGPSGGSGGGASGGGPSGGSGGGASGAGGSGGENVESGAKKRGILSKILG